MCCYVLEWSNTSDKMQLFRLHRSKAGGSDGPEDACRGFGSTARVHSAEDGSVQTRPVQVRRWSERLGDAERTWQVSRITRGMLWFDVKNEIKLFSFLFFLTWLACDSDSFCPSSCSGRVVVMATEAERISLHRLQRKSKRRRRRRRCLCCLCRLSRMWATTAAGRRKCGFPFSPT